MLEKIIGNSVFRFEIWSSNLCRKTIWPKNYGQILSKGKRQSILTSGAKNLSLAINTSFMTVKLVKNFYIEIYTVRENYTRVYRDINVYIWSTIFNLMTLHLYWRLNPTFNLNKYIVYRHRYIKIYCIDRWINIFLIFQGIWNFSWVFLGLILKNFSFIFQQFNLI